MDILRHAQELVLPRDPLDFAWKLRSWGMDTSHEGISLVLDSSVLDYMKDWSFGYLYDNFRLIVCLYNMALIGTRLQIGSSQHVVVDELLLQTTQCHKIIYRRKEGVLISPAKLHYAVMSN